MPPGLAGSDPSRIDVNVVSFARRALSTRSCQQQQTNDCATSTRKAAMASSRDADTIEGQNDQRLDELTSKIRTLRGVRVADMITFH